MPITCTTPQQQIEAYLNEQIARREQAIIRSFIYVGERALNAARSTNSYRDQTGNLRSSIGYVVAKDGAVVQMSDFEVVKEGCEGQTEGRDYISELVGQHQNGIVLIVVAGMQYAYFVKKMGYDVIDSAELLADKLVPQMLEKIGLK